MTERTNTARAWRVLVVDDEKPARDRLTELLSRERDFELVAACSDGLEAVRAIQEQSPDVVILDVQMPELTGFDVIEAVGSDVMPFVIFVTAHDQFAVAAFDANAVDYILKPFDDKRFAKALDRIRQRLATHQLPALSSAVLEQSGHYRTRLVVKHGGAYEIIDASSVDWFEAADNYVRLHIGRDVRLIRGTMSSVAARLDPAIFLRIQRSTIVNMARISAVEPWNKTDFALTLKDGTRLASGRTYRAHVRAFMERR